MARLYLSPHHVLRLKQIQSLSQNAIKRTILPVRGAHLGYTLTLMAMGRNPDIIRVKTLIVPYEMLRNAKNTDFYPYCTKITQFKVPY